jgi:predicted transcriptional regulator
MFHILKLDMLGTFGKQNLLNDINFNYSKTEKIFEKMTAVDFSD